MNSKQIINKSKKNYFREIDFTPRMRISDQINEAKYIGLSC
jgi:hypothetical protein